MTQVCEIMSTATSVSQSVSDSLIIDERLRQAYFQSWSFIFHTHIKAKKKKKAIHPRVTKKEPVGHLLWANTKWYLDEFGGCCDDDDDDDGFDGTILSSDDEDICFCFLIGCCSVEKNRYLCVCARVNVCVCVRERMSVWLKKEERRKVKEKWKILVFVEKKKKKEREIGANLSRKTFSRKFEEMKTINSDGALMIENKTERAREVDEDCL